MNPYYDDGHAKIYHGSCLDVLPLLESVDHTISDPPYARDVYLRAASCTATDRGYSDYELKRRGPALKRMAAGDIGSIDDMLEGVAGHVSRLTRRWAVIFSDAETTYRWRAALESGGMRYVRTGAWVKPDAMPQMSGDRPAVGFEPCTITHAQGPMRWNGGGSTAVWTHFTSKGDARPDHPCPKPIPLMVELVKEFTDEGELVLDMFGGSGTTGVACKLNGRRCILIERDEAFCEVAAKRLAVTEAGRLFDAAPKAKAADLFGEAAS
jgi:hypothetical protein